MMEKVIVVLNTVRIFDYMRENETEADAISRAEKFYTEEFEIVTRHYNNYGGDYWKNRVDDVEAVLNKGFSIMSFEECQAMEKLHLTSGQPEEITADKFNEMLDILPPLKWCTIDGIEMFCISEMYTGTYTNQYAHDKSSGKYYTKMVDACDKSTWINNYLRKI